jgi:hypothetical protein
MAPGKIALIMRVPGKNPISDKVLITHIQVEQDIFTGSFQKNILDPSLKIMLYFNIKG